MKKSPSHSPFKDALFSFIYFKSPSISKSPFIRDPTDSKRWMMIVIYSLIPCCIMAILNQGAVTLAYSTFSPEKAIEYIASQKSLLLYGYFLWNNFGSIVYYGSSLFFPLVFTAYLSGIFVEYLFAKVRKKPISEGLLVTGLLFALILPPTTPLWIVAIGMMLGTFFAKEVFGGSGMNIVNPALAARAFIYFGYPKALSGHVFLGPTHSISKKSLQHINTSSIFSNLDAITESTPLSFVNTSNALQRIHTETIASHLSLNTSPSTFVTSSFQKWLEFHGREIISLIDADLSTVKEFVIGNSNTFGLGLSNEMFQSAYSFTQLQYGVGSYNISSLFFGQQLGSLGESSLFAILCGAAILLYTKIASYRIMLSIIISTLVTSLLFSCLSYSGVYDGLLNPSRFSLPPFTHFFVGGLSFGLVFMATDPVSSASLPFSKWIYGSIIGFITVCIRFINPAFPEGVMLAILFANILSPLLDSFAVNRMRKKRSIRVEKLRHTHEKN